MAKYLYNARLAMGCELFEVAPISEELQNLAELIVTSKYFESADECSDMAIKFMSTLANLLEQITDTKYVVVTKMNPLYDKDKRELEKGEANWDDYTITRYFVVEAEAFKKDGKLNYTISSRVSLSKPI